ncbi:MAG: RNA 2',3'-cyclic phosphodiesterase [Thermoprotei archaeon]|nr:MAG: RNA 2',3'-cyclic phosphodiesterase [Thermoprotei archaeon]
MTYLVSIVLSFISVVVVSIICTHARLSKNGSKIEQNVMEMSSHKIRSFISIDIDKPEIVEKIKRVQGLLKDKNTRIKLVEPENLHLTLRFLGEISANEVEEIISALSKIQDKSFSIYLKNLGAFPSIPRARVVWIGVSEGADQLKELSHKVNTIIDSLRIGYKDSKEFTPHLTIGRIKSKPSQRLIKTLLENSDVDIGKVEVKDFRLKQSILTPRGPIYKTLHSFKLL